ncbi:MULTISPECIES: AMP-binding protein [unclassified Variovorax]|uniref:class I adenylate-forming enzyme family protein n=1 Tax=unclassified Variovorax TaxID=663243 RepID=UPI0025784356|nr:MULTISPECIES: AMP-binding protein [unclassified Variovorax]MDM0090971.1 AMP-binding protein [Variovorax sp. J22G40]MDM0149027.1 AMP-binding protein [Variovorax sp. J2P1-31]
MDFVSLLDQHALVQPTREALRQDGRAWTYAELAELTRRAATVLRAQGVGPGDKVALLCFNTPGFVLAMFGAWRLGAAVVPVNHKLQAPEIDYLLAHSGARLCLVDGTLAPQAARVAHRCDWLATAQAAEGLPLFEDLLAQAAPLADAAPPAADTPAQILYTSGTTGKPKGCLHSHRNVFMAAVCTAAGMALSRNERTLIAMPVWHSSPLNNWLLGTLLMGGTVVLLREYAPKAFLDTLAAERISFTFGAPIAFLAPLSVVPDVAGYDFSAMRLWAYGGGPLGADMARKLAQGYRSDRFVQVYGMTESGPLGTVLYPEDAIAKAGSIGRAGVPGVAVEVRHPDGRRCAAGEVGEIHLRSPAVMQGYLDNPQATAEAFDPQGWYRTGDLARIDEDGFLFIVDRLRDMIITGGENVYSKEVEDALAAHPEVQDVAVIGRPHPEWGETVTAVLVARPGCTLEAQALGAFLEPRLARYKIPRVYEVRETLPRTATGKLLKHLLRAPP